MLTKHHPWWAVGGAQLALPVCLILAAGPAGATLWQRPVEIRVAGPPRAAEPGKPFEGVLEIVATRDAELRELSIDTGRSWRLSGGSIARSLDLAKGNIHRIPFTVTTDDPTEPLVLQYQVGDELIRKELDLSPAAVASQQGGKLVRVDDPQELTALMSAIDPLPQRPEPAPKTLEDVHRQHRAEPPRAAEEADQVLVPAARAIRVVGFFTYRRMSDGLSVGVDGATARVYDEDTGPDELLASQVLGPDGRLAVTFNWDPCFGCDGTPDLYVEFELENAEVDVHDDSLFEADYRFETGVWPDFGGGFLDVGVQMPGDAGLIPACHIMTNATRAWRFAANANRDTPKVDYQWPDNDGCGACYDDGLEEVYIDSNRQWNENTIIHEFGHHFVNTFAVIVPPDYCPSSFCNSPTCGHCIWCQETDHDAFSEGFANYYQDVVMRGFTTPPVTTARSYEVLMRCTNDGANAYHDPWTTEGHFAALLHDIDDVYGDNDFSQPRGKDKLNLGFDEILWLVDTFAPTTPAMFIDRFRQEYSHLKEPFWATAANNGYNFDTQPPGAVTNITSDHALNQNWSTNPNIKWFWNRAPDDASGIYGYSIWVQQGILPGMPDATMEVFDVTEFTSGPHTPGWYYISIRAVDNNGVWSDTYETAGPYGIRPADVANLTVPIHSNWSYLGVTGRHVPDTQEFSAAAPSYLDGQGGTTFLSTLYRNSGELVTPVDQVWVDFYVDGYQVAYNHHLGYLNPGVYRYVLNQPVTIAGGRHVLGVRLDDSDWMSEPNELDNQWARQWAWTGPWIGLGAPAFYSSPPPPYQGTEWIVDGSAFYPNCRGFKAQDEVLNYPNNMWTAMTLHATDEADYDLSVFSSDTSPTGAFTSAATGSYRVAGATDVFLFNSWQYFGIPVPLDYGVTNYSGGVPGQNGFYLQKVTSQSLGFPGSTFDILGPNEMLKLYQFSATFGYAYAKVQVHDPTLGQVYLTLVPQSFVLGPLSGAGTTVVSDAVTGEASIDETQGGFLCLAVWRDPSMGTGPLAVTVSIQPTPADLAVVSPPGWAAPLVPRPANDGSPGAVPAPAVLHGDAAMTWVNYAVTNLGRLWVPPNPTSALYADGALIFTEVPSNPFPSGTVTRNLPTAFQIRGGRHTLGLHLDYTSSTIEISEANNWTAGQWVWQPSSPAFDLTQVRPVPPGRFAGWNLMPAGTPLWFNMDGLRTAAPAPDGSGDGWKVAALAIPDEGTDFDLKLFEAAPNAVSGFDVELVSSAWGIDQADFVVADFRVTAPRQLDVGHVAPTVQPGGAVVQFRRSKYLGFGPAGASTGQPADTGQHATPLEAGGDGIHGPFTVGSGSLFDLFEVDLPAGACEVRLVAGPGSVDWGIAVLGPGEAFLSRSQTLPGATSWDGPAGAGETLSFTVPQPGLHGVVVWKNRRLDVNVSGSFTLEFEQQTTDVAGGRPSRSASLIQGVRPNPFAASAQVEVQLDQPADVSLQVFNAAGRRLHSAHLGRMEAGAHALDWDGRDDQGRPVAAGIYFVRVDAANESDIRKIVRVR